MGHRLVTAGLLIGVLLATCALASLGTPGFQRVVTEAVIKLVVVAGMAIFVGNSGVLSFGHVSFMAIGGYLSAILTMAPARKGVLLDLPGTLEGLELHGLPAALVAGSVTALFALVIGAPLCRLRGIALPMATFAVLAIVHVVALNWKAVTGGRQALVGLPQTTNLWVACAGAAVTLVVAALYQQSRRGLLLRCARENETAAEATGIDIARERLIAFAISAFFVAIGGALFSHFLGTVTANTFYLDMTFVTLAMLVVGGMRSLTGAFAGVALVTIVTEVFRGIEKGVPIAGTTVAAPPGSQEIALAIIMLIVLIFRPDGLVGGYELGWPIGRGSRRGAEAPTATGMKEG